MAKIPSLPDYLTKVDIQKLIEACEKFYAVELLGEGYRGYLATTWAIPSLGYSWKNSRNFFKDISALTQQENIKGVYAVLAGWEKEAPLVLPEQAAEGLSETVPRNLKELEEALDKAKGEKEKAALIKSYQFLKSKAAPEVPVATPATGQPSPAARGEAPTRPEPFTVGINIAPEAGRAFQKFTNRVASLPIRTAIAWAAPTVASEQPGPASAALTLWARGITSESVQRGAQTVEEKEAKELDNLAKAIKGLETNYSLQTRILQQSYPFKKVSLLLRPGAGVTQAQIAIFFNPPEAGGTTAVPKRGFFGNLLVNAGGQLFGKVSSKALARLGFQKAISKAISPVVEQVATAVGAGIGGPVGAAIGKAVGWVLAWLASKIPDAISWFKRNAKEFGLAAVALFGSGVFLSNPVLIISGLVLGAVALGAGGIGAVGASAAELGQAAIGGVTNIVLPAVGVPILVGLLSVPVLVAIILFIINSGAYVVPPRPFETAFGGPPINCSDQKGPVGLGAPGGSSSPVANRAWEITYDLYQGFWCFWNRSPGSPPHPDFPNDILTYPDGYPNLFDYSLFRTNPNPSRSGVSNLFWCTWLPIKAYADSGSPIGVNIYSPDMYNDFKARGKIVDRSQASPNNVKSGAVVFFDVDNTLNRIDHVGVVYEINQDGLTFVQSNAPTKSGSIPFGKSGLQNLPGIQVIAIGNP